MSTSQKCSDALRLGSKGKYSSIYLWINVWVAGKTAKLCDSSLTYATPQRLRDDQLIRRAVQI